ncbi:chloramphenicol-sensitive protein RarD [Orbus hercynius]|uniref:Chloramphenicol-sensitive protein RarD n=1 Tax=Orbus hercynius TaxID=593135 RepID=A0A495RAY7_9GAMM|nr:EamA family transporter RarD [Orbus hercynius]RKS84642.1 chloramphenicol-sensitive protein RarD [Orbus hercynius]
MYKGILLSLSASCLFGLVYYYPVFLKPLSIIDIFCWRLLMSFPAIMLLVCIEKQWRAIIDLFQRIRQQPLFLLALIFSSLLLSIQMLIFVWAPLSGKALSTSLGYFMLPLTMVICGRVFYKERFSFLQKIAVVLAFVGVALEVYITGAFSWETAVICLGYPIYFMFRRYMNIDGIAGTFSDFFFVALGCLCYFVIQYDMHKISDDVVHFHIFIPLLGIITAIAFAAYFSASRLLPLGIFGLLGYVEPILLAIVSIFFLHESISSEHIISYGLIWGAVCVLILEGLVYTIRNFKYKRIK